MQNRSSKSFSSASPFSFYILGKRILYATRNRRKHNIVNVCNELCSILISKSKNDLRVEGLKDVSTGTRPRSLKIARWRKERVVSRNEA